MKNRKIFVVGRGNYYANWMEGEMVYRMQDANLVVFTGGEDVCPELYDRDRHPSTSCNNVRDQAEYDVFIEAVNSKKKMIGICRGAQFLCAASGGILVQDQQNPEFIHPIDTYDGRNLLITSTHHQAMYPWLMAGNEFKVLGWSTGISKYHKGQTDKEELVIGEVAGDKEVEICFFPKTRALGIQGHPEMIYDNRDRFAAGTETIEYLQGLLDKFMEDKL